MKHREDAFQSGSGERLYYQSWSPEGPARAILLLVHGLAEHGGRYADFAGYFATAGFVTYALDYPGHGKSEGTPGHIRRFTEYTDALRGLLLRVQEAHPGVPIVLVGHSMGGLISAAILPEQQHAFAACVLSGPLVRLPQMPSRTALFVMRIIAALVPKMGMLQLDATGVSRDPQVVSAYVNDPLVYTGKVTARLFAELFGAMKKLLVNAPGIKLPMLFLHGGSDSLTAVEGSRMLHERVGSKDKQLIVFEGLYHEIFNEPEREQVMGDMLEWLNSRLPGDTGA